jgi:hypothetical protein
MTDHLVTPRVTVAELIVAVPTATLVDLLDPFNCTPWDGMPAFTVSQVRLFVDAGRLHPHRIVQSHDEPAEIHLARIAYLVEHWPNDGTDPPQVEVWPARYGYVTVHDGYHRICAAITRGDPHILVDLAGDLDLAEDMLGIDIP